MLTVSLGATEASERNPRDQQLVQHRLEEQLVYVDPRLAMVYLTEY